MYRQMSALALISGSSPSASAGWDCWLSRGDAAMSSNDPAVVVIVPNWNGAHLLPSCLDGLRRQRFTSFHTVVVDDGSRDASLRLLHREYHEVQILRCIQRHGFCAAVNAGIQATTSRYIALLNTDAVPEPGWLSALVHALDTSSDYSGCTPKVLFADRPGIINSIGIFLRRDGASRDIGYGQPDGPDYSRRLEVFGFSGCAVLLRRSAVEDVGLFDEELVAYAEDLDWSLRARLRGHRFMYEPSARALHRVGGTFSRLPARAAYYRSRNSLYVLLKNLPWPILVKHAPAMALFQLYQVAIAGRHGMLWPALAGKADVVRGWRRLLASRRRLQAARRLADDEVEQLLRTPVRPWGSTDGLPWEPGTGPRLEQRLPATGAGATSPDWTVQ